MKQIQYQSFFLIIKHKTLQEKQIDERQEDALSLKSNWMLWITLAISILIIVIIFFSRAGIKNSANHSPNTPTPFRQSKIKIQKSLTSPPRILNFL